MHVTSWEVYIPTVLSSYDSIELIINRKDINLAGILGTGHEGWYVL